MKKSLQNPLNLEYYTMMFLVLLGLLVVFGAFVLGPLVTIFK